jgi:hypothetical protein
MVSKELWCTPQTAPGTALVFYSSYIIVSGLIMVTLFTGAVAVSMTDAMLEMAQKKKQDSAARAEAAGTVY